ncbi:TetR family transcriptional regulator [Georgenia deserti]|uniref:TetR family transcriptional regulator n=1 Tax=Georgenia deserti TaxID=2093781 RepID=A0ABW4L3Y1_9MICO
MSRTRARGRRPGGPDTRHQILDAARQEFAERSFAATTVRSVASRAGVDPALIHHYFGTKRDLFMAALDLPLEPEVLLGPLRQADPDDVGKVLVTVVLDVWEDAASRAPFVALLRSATSDAEAAANIRQALEAVMLPALRPILGPTDEPARADTTIQLAVAQLLGAMFLRHVVRVEPLASASREELAGELAPVIQQHLRRNG